MFFQCIKEYIYKIVKKEPFSRRVYIAYRVICAVGIQIAIDVIEDSAHTGQILVIFACLVVYGSLWDVISQSRIGRNPCRIFTVEIPCSVVVETHARNAGYRACFILQLKRHDSEPLLNCQRAKLQNSSWGYLAENSLSSRFIIMHRC
mgnify:CR=1 FL=1